MSSKKAAVTLTAYEELFSSEAERQEVSREQVQNVPLELFHPFPNHPFMVLPVVEKEILWSKRCKDEKLRGTVKEVVNQISHSKKWKSDIPMTDEKGNPLLKKNGKPMFRASYTTFDNSQNFKVIISWIV